MVRHIVGRQRVLLAVNRKLPFGDPVAVTPHGRAEIGVPLQVTFQLRKPKLDIGQLAVLVGRLHRHDRRAVIHHLQHQAVFVGAGVKRDFGAVLCLAEGGMGDVHG